jgi:hypothetical protein
MPGSEKKLSQKITNNIVLSTLGEMLVESFHLVREHAVPQ